ncbi:Deubiquitination-protection protein dph1 [Apiospora arundinis]|uniref:Deubiquitination-protection protein dph1 n=1 Tax=Apiospora arundinis TaxID=335852 RepID=A0ABR2HQ49_9PEZI
MADNAEASSDAQVTFNVKTSGDRKHTLTMAETATVNDLKTKLATKDYEDIPIERQRLIYSGRVMKNEEPLSTYKIKSGNTVHLVKSAASNPTPAPPASSSTPAAPQVPTNMAAGTANNPLAGLTGARYAGLTGLPSADMFGPDGGMVGSMMDEEQMANMLSNPNVAQQMNEMMNNDQFLDMMIQQNPMLRNNPNAREILRSPMFRHMMTNPDALRSAARMQRSLRGGGGGAAAFPAPGVTDNTPSSNEGGNNAAAGQPANPFDPMAWAGLGIPGGQAQGGADASNPFAALLGAGNPFMGMGAQPGQQPAAGTQPAGATGGAGEAAATAQSGDANSGATTGAAAGATPAGGNPPPNPFAALFGGMPGAGAGAGAGGATNPYGLPPGMPPMSNESLMQMMQMLGMNSPGGGGSPAPADNRPPEERYADQLRQLNDMGFYDFDRNIAALRRSGGSVQGAVEHLLSS